MVCQDNYFGRPCFFLSVNYLKYQSIGFNLHPISKSSIMYNKYLQKNLLLNNLFFILILLLLITGCSEEESSPIIVRLTPMEPLITAAVGDKVIFHADVTATDLLSDFKITQEDFKYGFLILQDSSLSGKRFVQDYVFEAPVIPDSAIIKLTFIATDVNYNDVRLVRRVRVLGDNVLLEESTGHVLFSATSGGYSAFNLDVLQPLSKNEPDSLLHFADHSVDSVHLNTLSREWYSPAGYRFVRFEGFSYPEATRSKLQNAYDSGIKLSSVNNIANDDVILID